MPENPIRPAMPVAAEPKRTIPAAETISYEEQAPDPKFVGVFDPKHPANNMRSKRRKKRSTPKAPVKPKNPNRPLEMRKRLNVALEITSQLTRPETEIFVGMLKQLDKLKRGARAKVLDGLKQVFS